MLNFLLLLTIVGLAPTNSTFKRIKNLEILMNIWSRFLGNFHMWKTADSLVKDLSNNPWFWKVQLHFPSFTQSQPPAPSLCLFIDLLHCILMLLRYIKYNKIKIHHQGRIQHAFYMAGSKILYISLTGRCKKIHYIMIYSGNVIMHFNHVSITFYRSWPHKVRNMSRLFTETESNSVTGLSIE